VVGQAVDMATAEALGLPAPEGVLLSDLHPQSPFAAAGLAAGDVILSLDGQPVSSPQEVMYRLAVAGTGQEISIGYWHESARREVSATLSPPPQGDRQETTVTDDVALRGLTVARLDPALVAELGLPLGAEGVVVLDAQDRAARAGFRPGDLVLGINGAEVRSPGDVAALAGMAARRWAVDLLRGGEPLRLLFRF
jgi:S1-C subfamily serine protease